MHKKFPVAFVAALLLLAMACKKDPPVPDVSCDKPTNDKEVSKQLIVGTWQWDRTIRFFDINEVIKPDSAHDNVKLVFRSDGIVEHYLNGKFNDTSSYEIDVMKKYTKFYADTTVNILYIRHINNILTYPAIHTIAPIRICNDSLYLKYESFSYHSGDNYFFRVK